MPVGNIPLAQFNRIDTGRFRQFVHGVFQHLHANRLARRPDRTAASPVDPRHFDAEPAIFPAIHEMGGLGDGLVKAFARQIGHQAFMADAGEHAVFTAGETDMLPRFRPAHGRFKHLRPRQGDADRLADFLCGKRGGHGFRRNTEFGTKAAANERRQHPDILRHDMQRVGQFVDIIIEHLIAAAQRQLVAIPTGNGAMRFHRGAVVTRSPIDLIHRICGIGHRLIEITLIELIIFRFFPVGVRCLRVKGGMAFRFIADFQHIGRVARLFETVRNHQRDRLAEIIDLLCSLRRCLIGPALRRSPQQTIILDYRAHPVLADDAAARHIRDATLGDGCADQHTMNHIRDVPFVRVGRLAGNLEWTIRAIHRRSNQTLNHVVEPVARVRLVHFLMRGHAAAPVFVASFRTEINTRLVSGILKSLLP